MRFPGQTLREKREGMGCTLEDVHARIHVPVEALRALEEGSLQSLTVKAYAVGFLQTYCRFLELAPVPFIDQFNTCLRQGRGQRTFAFVSRNAGDDGIGPRPRWLDDAITWGTVCAVILFGWLGYTMVVRPMADNWKGRVEAGTVEITPPSHFEEKP